MRGQDEQARIAHADEGHQHEVGGMIVRQFAFFLDEFIAVTNGGFVAMVAIGDEDGLVVRRAT